MATNVICDRVFNFSPGPAMLPQPVLERIRDELLSLRGTGSSILEISHRDDLFLSILADAKARLLQLLGIPPNYHVIFLQGGSRLLFSMIPMNLVASGLECQYLVTGTWGKTAFEEAQRLSRSSAAWDGGGGNYSSLPKDTDWKVLPSAAYLHYTSNETIQGVQFNEEPAAGDVPLVCDASSDFLSRPIGVDRYGLIYACAQKNAGPAGVTIVIVRDDLLGRCGDHLPGYLNLRNHVENDSLYNTPPTFAIYVVGLVAEWIQQHIGGLANMAAINQRKADRLYDTIDGSDGFYQGHAAGNCRSRMNVTFRLPSDDLQKRFLSEAEQQDLVAIKGHRSVGGIRASIYNAMPEEGVERLRQLMLDFQQRHRS